MVKDDDDDFMMTKGENDKAIKYLMIGRIQTFQRLFTQVD